MTIPVGVVRRRRPGRALGKSSPGGKKIPFHRVLHLVLGQGTDFCLLFLTEPCFAAVTGVCVYVLSRSLLLPSRSLLPCFAAITGVCVYVGIYTHACTHVHTLGMLAQRGVYNAATYVQSCYLRIFTHPQTFVCYIYIYGRYMMYTTNIMYIITGAP